MTTKTIVRVNNVDIIATSDEQLIAIKPICEALGIGAEAQRQKIMEHPILASTALLSKVVAGWKSHATLTLLAKQDLPTFGYNMIAPLKSWCWGSILFYPFNISRFS